MKIIARIDSSRLLVEMTEREVANVSGYNREAQVPYAGHYNDAFRCGAEYQVSPAWDRLQQQAKAAEQLEDVSKTLSALSDLVTQTKVQFTNATAECAPEPAGGAS